MEYKILFISTCEQFAALCHITHSMSERDMLQNYTQCACVRESWKSSHVYLHRHSGLLNCSMQSFFHFRRRSSGRLPRKLEQVVRILTGVRKLPSSNPFRKDDLTGCLTFSESLQKILECNLKLGDELFFTRIFLLTIRRFISEPQINK